MDIKTAIAFLASQIVEEDELVIRCTRNQDGQFVFDAVISSEEDGKVMDANANSLGHVLCQLASNLFDAVNNGSFWQQSPSRAAKRFAMRLKRNNPTL